MRSWGYLGLAAFLTLVAVTVLVLSWAREVDRLGVTVTDTAVGPPGPPGPAGAVGKAGARGSRGERGTAGARGARGAQGDPGAQGQQGNRGARGGRGARGVRGPGGLVCPPGFTTRTVEVDVRGPGSATLHVCVAG